MDFPDDEMTPEERQAMLVQMLQAKMGAGQQQQPQQFSPTGFDKAWGNQFLSTGDRVLAPLGASQIQQAQHSEGMAGEAKQRSLTQLIEAQRAASNEQHQRTQEDIARKQLEQGKYSQGAYGVLNNRTGQLTEMTKPAPAGGGANEMKDWKALSDSISTVKGRANLNADNQKRLYASERIKALAVGPDGQPLDLKPQQLQELASMSAALASNSVTEHSIQAMLPKGRSVGAANIEEWLLNEPKGAGQQAFVKMMLDQANREEHTIHGQLLKGQTQALPNYAHLRGKDKARYDAMLQGAGIDPALIDDKGLLVQPQEQSVGGGPVKIATPEEFNALPSGTEFIDPKGNHRRKP